MPTDTLSITSQGQRVSEDFDYRAFTYAVTRAGLERAPCNFRSKDQRDIPGNWHVLFRHRRIERSRVNASFLRVDDSPRDAVMPRRSAIIKAVIDAAAASHCLSMDAMYLLQESL